MKIEFKDLSIELQQRFMKDRRFRRSAPDRTNIWVSAETPPQMMTAEGQRIEIEKLKRKTELAKLEREVSKNVE